MSIPLPLLLSVCSSISFIRKFYCITFGGGSINTGGGGGGTGAGNSPAGGSGGSGIVVISYAGTQRATGGTVTSSGGYTIHTYTSIGSFIT